MSAFVKSRSKLFISIAIVFVIFISCNGGEHSEDDRIVEYHKRGYSWPPRYVPSTEGWEKLMNRRFDQVARLRTWEERWEGYMQLVTSAFVAPNFTETGWGLTRAPEELFKELQTSLRNNFDNARLEREVPVVEGPRPLWVSDPLLMFEVPDKLQSIHEQWAGIPLWGSNSYGFRLYQNQSYLNMHIDQSGTHVISSILHVDRSKDAEPWPIIIEDLQGNTNEVYLEPGDMLLYESSKCAHGRPKTFTGSWYTSVFTHFYPKNDWKRDLRLEESRVAVPIHWHDDPDEPSHLLTETCETNDTLEMVGTSMKEPLCPDRWCALKNSKKWYGPAKKDYVITTGKVFRLFDESP